jgi:hypothetical protein
MSRNSASIAADSLRSLSLSSPSGLIFIGAALPLGGVFVALRSALMLTSIAIEVMASSASDESAGFQ